MNKAVSFLIVLVIAVTNITAQHAKAESDFQASWEAINNANYPDAKRFAKLGLTDPTSQTTNQNESSSFRTIPISEWVGERFLFLPQQSIFQKYGYQLIFRADQRIGTLPYREYVGKTVRVTSVIPSSTVGGSWNVEFILEASGEKLKGLAVSSTINGLGLVADVENARTRYKGKTLWLKNSTLQILKAGSDKIAFLGVDISKPVKVVDVVPSWSDEAPVRFIIQTSDGSEGFRDVSMSGTNVSETLRKYHRFEKEFSVAEPRRDSDISKSTFSAPAASGQSDVLGWQDARWGMIEADILKAFGATLQKLSQRELFQNAYVDYVIPDFKLNGEIFTVRFQMDSRTKRLVQILIRLDQMESNSPRTDAFFSLEELLTQKYGAPRYKKDRTEIVISHQRRWTFPTTTVELGYSYIRGISSTLTIRYFPSSTSDANKL